ncbi:hypothetical protein NG798_09590 [Ancylothrix sp. C2]|uniref:hypothetical protein n=1 Tax=Ancylothrix sp. D3o TaxID=2953691 RepID=UPI0021BA910E|nr:hypothetical protein [Ancylothrix sp. D3o]MCT7950037.1 hypothetical protein [Ancylothrix sp. D3o]
MNRKHLVKFGCAFGSSLMLLQMAPLVHAGNMSDGTGHNANPVPTGNGSDYTGSLNQVIVRLVTTTLINIRGTAISREIQQSFAALLVGDADISSVVQILLRAGIEQQQALLLAQRLQGLIQLDGTINQAQLAQVVLAYRSIIASANIEFFLNPNPEFLALQAILSQLTQNQLDFAFIAPDVNTNPTLITLIRSLSGGSFTAGGVTVNSQFQAVLLNLILGRVDISTAVNTFVAIGIRADLAQSLAQGFQGLIQADGSINYTQLSLVMTTYQQVVANSSVAFLTNPSVEFLALQALLIQLGVNPTQVAINVPSNPGGGVTPPTDNAGGETPTTPGGGTKPGGDVAGKPGQGQGNGSGGNMSDGTGAIITTGDIAGNLSDATGPIVTTGDIAGKPDDKPGQIKPLPVANNNSGTSVGNNNNNGAGVIFIASYIGGPFSFANIVIQNAIRLAARSVVAQLRAPGSLTVQGRIVSFESKQVVLNILIAKNEANNGRFVSSCTRAGINGALAQNLAKSLQGLVLTDDGGEVSGVDATKLLAALGSYNAIIDSSSPQVLANRPGEVTVVQFSLSSMVKAGFSASSGNQTATTDASE